jgi:hypothetical protein
MAQTTDWEADLYQRTFDDEHRMLERRFAANPQSQLDEVRGQLKSLYISEGNDWEGRGVVGDITFSAMIAAFEAFIEERSKT